MRLAGSRIGLTGWKQGTYEQTRFFAVAARRARGDEASAPPIGHQVGFLGENVIRNLGTKMVRLPPSSERHQEGGWPGGIAAEWPYQMVGFEHEERGGPSIGSRAGKADREPVDRLRRDEAVGLADRLLAIGKCCAARLNTRTAS